MTPRRAPDSGPPGGGGGGFGWGAGSGPDAFAPFLPRRGRLVAIIAAVLSVGVFGAVAILLPDSSSSGSWTPGDRIMFAAIGPAISGLLWRYATIRAVPSEEGLLVRNLLRSRSVAWGEIEAVRFGGGSPWVTLDLRDADTLAVMAIQKADGSRSMSEARRLATLVARLG